MGTFVERNSRYLILAKLPGASVDAVLESFTLPSLELNHSTPTAVSRMNSLFSQLPDHDLQAGPIMSTSKSGFLRLICVLGLSILAACSQPASDLSKLPAQIVGLENHTLLQLDSNRMVSCLSKRSSPDETEVEFFELQKDQSGWRKRFSKQYQGSYNPRLEIRTDMTFNAKPIITLRMQIGAALETLEVFGLSDTGVTHLQTLDAGAFMWSTHGKNMEAVLIGLPSGHEGDKPDLYFWRGNQFQLSTGRKQ